MVIDKLQIKDIESLLELYNELVDIENDKDIAINKYKEILENDNYLLIVAKDGDEVVGSILGVVCKCLAMNGDNFLVIEDVIVKENARGHGIAKRLMQSIEEFAKSKKCAYSILVSGESRKVAHKFYEKSGFNDEVIGFRKMYKKI